MFTNCSREHQLIVECSMRDTSMHCEWERDTLFVFRNVRSLDKVNYIGFVIGMCNVYFKREKYCMHRYIYNV